LTGMHRSGTTWLGEMLCASGAFVRFDEPLNVRNRRTILASRAERWYTYIGAENEAAYLSDYRDALDLRPHPLRDLRHAWLGSPRNAARIPGDWLDYLRGRMEKRRVLFKDPFAVFSIHWFQKRLGCRVVVTVRHPLAVVSSLKRLGYFFDFKDLLEQPALMDRHLSGHRGDMESSSQVVDQGALLWRLVYGAVAEAMAAGDPPMVVVRHEDLSLRPLEEFAALYEKLDIPFTVDARRTIEDSTSAANPAESALDDPAAVRLDSRANLDNWRHRLSEAEVDRIMTHVQPVLAAFYPEDAQVSGVSAPRS
jgi:hypothetical protein